ncbi:HD domain-containing protein [Aceticella autotrophica]|uniref:HD domain-containing protein n=1 Tax=Aceticella autotrophica TaxID=2755338 RepID=A0A975GAM4_9THEO|nr:HD domain-containing protein [Aceticella autotrophica]QSZ27430.1 HD domain-containing protein [Aceticella autotrophica]
MSIICKLIDKLDIYANKVYIVGGTLRDKILKKEINDYDFAVEGDASQVAKIAAEKLGGTYVPYGQDKGTYRVVVKDIIMDFSSLKGNDIYEDLLHRDFTINAMALRLNDYFEVKCIIDPFGGMRDLWDKKIRCVGIRTFPEDPLRMLRAIRFSAVLRFNIDEKTKLRIKENAKLISNISSERIMYEIYTILKVKNSYQYLRMIDDLTLMDYIFPEVKEMKEMGKCYYHLLNAWHNSIKTVEEYEIIIEYLKFPKGILETISEYLNRELSAGNKIKDVLKLAALFHEIGKTKSIYIDTKNRIHFYHHDKRGGEILSSLTKRMKMGKKEALLIKKMVLYHVQPFIIYTKGFSNKQIFKLFSDLEDNSIGCLLLSQADVAACKNSINRTKDAERYRNFILQMFRKYMIFKETEEPLLSALDIIGNFDLKDNKILGQILYEIRKNRFYGEIEDKNDAIRFVEERMKIEKI